MASLLMLLKIHTDITKKGKLPHRPLFFEVFNARIKERVYRIKLPVKNFNAPMLQLWMCEGYQNLLLKLKF